MDHDEGKNYMTLLVVYCTFCSFSAQQRQGWEPALNRSDCDNTVSNVHMKLQSMCHRDQMLWEVWTEPLWFNVNPRGAANKWQQCNITPYPLFWLWWTALSCSLSCSANRFTWGTPTFQNYWREQAVAYSVHRIYSVSWCFFLFVGCWSVF